MIDVNCPICEETGYEYAYRQMNMPQQTSNQ